MTSGCSRGRPTRVLGRPAPGGALARRGARAWRGAVVRLGALVAALGAAAGIGAGCAREPTDATPTGALRLFLDAMDRAEQDARALEEAYALLDAGAREALAHRAHDAAALGGGREFAPWEMLAQGRFRLRFSFPEYGAMRERVDGDRAVVTVTGAGGARAEVPLVREDGRWRVALELPRPARAAQAPGAAPDPAEPARRP